MSAPLSSLTAPIRIVCGEDWTITLVYRRDGVMTRVDDPVGDIRAGLDANGVLLLRLDDQHIDQPADGQLDITVPHTVTSTLKPGVYRWDLFGYVAGRRRRLVPTSPCEVEGSVTGIG